MVLKVIYCFATHCLLLYKPCVHNEVWDFTEILPNHFDFTWFPHKLLSGKHSNDDLSHILHLNIWNKCAWSMFVVYGHDQNFALIRSKESLSGWKLNKKKNKDYKIFIIQSVWCPKELSSWLFSKRTLHLINHVKRTRNVTPYIQLIMSVNNHIVELTKK